MLQRISHATLGLGICLDEFKTEGGKQAVRAVFDNRPDEERILLSEFVQSSTARMPDAAKTVAKKKRVTKPKPELVSDDLLYESRDEYLAAEEAPESHLGAEE